MILFEFNEAVLKFFVNYLPLFLTSPCLIVFFFSNLSYR